MNHEQRAARDGFAALLENTAQADANYNALLESRGGRIISTDIARFLESRYRDTPEGKPRDLAPGWDMAWRYAQDRLRREIEDRKGRRFISFMAGGWGAGKTHALQGADLRDVAWDGTLKDYLWARDIIELALLNGWRVEIAYVFRDIELALYGAVEREVSEGRGVPLPQLPGNHRAVQQSILRLIRRYRDESRVAFLLLHNTGMKGVSGKSLDVAETDLARNGPLHYTKDYEDYYAEAAREIQALNPALG